MDNVILLSVVGMAVFAGFGVARPITSPYAEFPQADYFMIGLLSTAGSLAAFLAGYFWGRQSDRMAGRKVFLAAGLAGSCLSSGLMAVISSYLVPLSVADLAGSVAGSLLDYQPGPDGGPVRAARRRGRTMGIYRGLASLGFALMAFVPGSVAVGLPSDSSGPRHCCGRSLSAPPVQDGGPTGG